MCVRVCAVCVVIDNLCLDCASLSLTHTCTRTYTHTHTHIPPPPPPNTHSLLRLTTIIRRAHGSPYRFLDRITNVRQEVSYTERRIMTAVLLLLGTIHVFACLLWFVNRVQNFPGSPESCCNFPNGALLLLGFYVCACILVCGVILV